MKNSQRVESPATIHDPQPHLPIMSDLHDPLWSVDRALTAGHHCLYQTHLRPLGSPAIVPS